MTIDNSRYREIKCYERHLFIPLSNSSSGALTTSMQRLEFQKEISYNKDELFTQSKIAFVISFGIRISDFGICFSVNEMKRNGILNLD